ncbi:unnamed protein product, partial [Phaeothamnion confervicola]
MLSTPDLVTVEAATAALPPLSPTLAADLPRAISAASDACVKFVGRPLAPTRCVEWHDPGNTRVLRLGARPVLSVQRIAAGLANVLRVTYAGDDVLPTAALDWTDGPAPGPPTSLTLSRIVAGVPTSSTLPLADTPSLDALAGAIGALPGWSAEILGPYGGYPAAWLRSPQGPTPADSTGATFAAHLQSLSGWFLESPSSGRIVL